MKIAVWKKHYDLNQILFSIILFVVFWNTTIFPIRYRYAIIGILCCVVLSILCCLYKKRIKKFQKTDYLLLLMLAIVFLNRNYDIKAGEYSYEVLFFYAVFVAIIDKENLEKYVNTFMDFSFVFGSAAAIVTILCFLIPPIYTSALYPVAVSEYKLELYYAFSHGYQPGFASHYSTNGNYLAMLVAVLFCKWIACKKKERTQWFCFLLVALFALFLTAKRAHVVFSLFAMIAVYFFYNSDKKVTRVFKLISITVIGLLIFTIASYFVPELENVFQRFSKDSQFSFESLFGERTVLYAFAITLFLQNPFIGKGWNSYKYLAEIELNQYNAVHNVFLQLLAENGIVGFVVFVAFLVLSLFKGTKALSDFSHNNASIKTQQVQAFMLFFMIFNALYCLTGNPFYENTLIIPYILIGASTLKSKAKSRRN